MKRSHPYAHPQHMRVVVVKHLDVIDNEVGAISDGYSLNNHTTLLFAPWQVLGGEQEF